MDEDEERKLVSEENYEKSHLHPVDEKILHSAATGEGLIELTPERWEGLKSAIQETVKVLDEWKKSYPMTDQRASFIRRLRVDEGYTWRAVADACHQEFNGDWQPPSNQIWGQALCELAAEFYGETAQDGWN